MPHLIGTKNPAWKGGQFTGSRGYVFVWLSLDDFFHPMVDKSGYVVEHRYIMAKSLGRCLQLSEVVHHKNGIKDDNRIENLQLMSDLGHKQLTHLVNLIHKLQRKITVLQIENAQ